MTEESLFQFPCNFILKVFGLDSLEFETAVLTIVSKHVKELRENSFQYRKSQDHKYLSITVRFVANNQKQLDSMYRDLSSDPHVMMVI